ncbi:MAG: YIP1 family protein [Candidatus Eremiobacteraeota bacterium]|nr:YIP1 family protein [Candidatus Eremiobacteraeota bacterium]
MALDSTAPRAQGLKTVLDTIVSPKEAFESIRIIPTWGWALAIAVVLSSLGTYLMAPALQHAFASGWPAMVAKDPNLAQLSADKQQSILAMNSKIFGFAWLFSLIVVPIICLIEAVVMLIFNAIGRGEGTFGKYFAASCNIAVPSAGLYSIVSALIVTIRGADSFGNMQSLQTVLPSLAYFAPAASPKLTALLNAANPFSIWGVALSIAAMLIIGRVSKVQAWLAGIVLFIIPALLATAGAK